MMVASLDFKSFGVEFLHSGEGIDSFTEGELYFNIGVKTTKEPLRQDMIVGDSRVDGEEGEGGDVFVES